MGLLCIQGEKDYKWNEGVTPISRGDNGNRVCKRGRVERCKENVWVLSWTVHWSKKRAFLGLWQTYLKYTLQRKRTTEKNGRAKKPKCCKAINNC